MTSSDRIERALDLAFARADSPGCPGQLAAAMRYAVFPRGARVRPRLALAVAAACGDDEPALVDAAAAAIELLHCASLVHDDLPCFDDAALRRGRPSVHKAFDQRLAVLAGDALIVLAFQTLAQVPAASQRVAPLVMTLARAVGMPLGIVAGQAWECEPAADVSTYHRQKTGSLFAGATMMGATACGADPGLWRGLGEKLGEAYQAADDIGDAASDAATLGKPTGRDVALGRPSLVGTFGMRGALQRLGHLVEEAIAAIPPCPGAADLKTLIVNESMRLVPKELVALAANPSPASGRRWPGEAGSDEGTLRATPSQRGSPHPSSLRADTFARRAGEGFRGRLEKMQRTLAAPDITSRPSLRDTWRAARDRLLASARFQRWASGFPLTRSVARRRARALFDLCAGFVYSQILFACIQTHLFDILAEGPQSLDTLSRRLALQPDAARRLLAAACSLGLVDRRGPDRYGLGSLGAALLGNPSLAAMIDHHAHLYADLADPVALLRGAPRSTALADYWPYAGTGNPADLTAPQVGPYTALMAASQAMIAGEVLDAYPLHRHGCLLDVGGGDGAFATAAAARSSHLRVMVFDLPSVAERARARFAAAGLTRATAVGGNIYTDALPLGADVASLVRVIHDHDDPGALAILRAVRAALPEHGTLLLAEPMADTPGAERVGHAYFGFYLLAMGRGLPRTRAELASLLQQSGFDRLGHPKTRTPC